MPTNYDVIVIGLGTMGASACWHLSQQGYRVLGLDQYEVPHAFGSHHGHSRMIRLSYFEHPDYVPLLIRSYELWRELEKATSRDILTTTGGLYLSPENGVIVPGCLKASQEHGLDYQLLDQAELSKRFPQFTIPDGYRGFYESVAGVLLVEPAMESFFQLIRERGGTIQETEPVLSWRADEETVFVRTSMGEYSAARLIVTSGAWSSELLQGLGPGLEVTRQTMFWLRPPEALPAGASRFPAWFAETSSGKGIYGFPVLPGQEGIKVADHNPGPVTSLDSVDRSCREKDWEDFEATISPFLSWELGRPLAMKTCLYTNSPDGHFIVDRHPEFPSVCFGAGFSGHGFKFAPVIGESLAHLATEGHSTHSIEFLRVGRFLNGQ